MYKSLSLVLLFLEVTVGQRLQCSGQWQSLQKCTNDRQYDYRRNKDLTSSERREMKEKIRLCFKNARCGDPFPSDREQQARLKCYVQFRDKMTLDLKACIGRTYPDYSVPSAQDDSAVSNGQDMLSMRSSNCKPADKQTFAKCVIQARGPKGRNQPASGKQVDYCAVRCSCYQQARLTTQCFDRSARVREEMCRCYKRLPFETYKSVYVQCMKYANFAIKYEEQDFTLVTLKKLSASGGPFCNNFTDPCGGFKNQQCDQQRSRFVSSQGSTSGTANSMGGSSGGSVNSGAQPSVSSGQQTSGANSNTNVNTGGTSTSANGSAAIDTASLGTASSLGIDPGNVASGDLLPDPSSVLSSTTNNLGSGLGIGGLDMSNLMSDGFSPTSFLSGIPGLSGGMPDFSSFIGGGLPGLGGSGGGLPGLGGSSGGLPDLSSLTSGGLPGLSGGLPGLSSGTSANTGLGGFDISSLLNFGSGKK